MSDRANSGRLAVENLRREFDRSFQAPPGATEENHESLVTIRVAGEALAVRTRDITEVARHTRIVPVPTRVPGLLGITAIRGALFPVYDLAALLGFPPAAGLGSWLMLTNRETPVGLAFDELEARVEISRACLYGGEPSLARAHLRLVARLEAGHRAVVDIPGIVEQIRKTAGVLEPVKE